MITIYHNPRCSKSRQTLQLIKERKDDAEIQIVEYLKEHPSREEFVKVLAKLNMKPTELIRKGEEIYKKELKSLNLTDDEWIDVMLENPKLIERPIVIKDNKAILGRPPENVFEFL